MVLSVRKDFHPENIVVKCNLEDEDGMSVLEDYCEEMAYVAPRPQGLPFGNSRWNAAERAVPGELEFLTASSKCDGGFAARFYRIKVSFALRTYGCQVVYRPHLYEIRWNCGGGTWAGMSLVFPPGRQGAVLRIWGPPGVRSQSQVLLFGGSPYPDFEPSGRIFSVTKGGLVAKAQFVMPDGHEFMAGNVWQSARVGARGAGEYHVLFAFGTDETAVDAELQALWGGVGGWENATKRWWNEFFASCPVIVPDSGMKLPEGVLQERFVTRQLWHYHLSLSGVVDATHMLAAPIQVADRHTFNHTYSNDNTYGVMALCLTNQAPLARAHLVNLFKHMINKDGQIYWSMDCNGNRSSPSPCWGIPAAGHALGFYLRTTGDVSILDDDAGCVSVWEKLKLHDEVLTSVRDSNGDGLVEWNHIWETGEDNKVSPFFRKKGLLEWAKFYSELGDKDVTSLPFYQDNVCPVTIVNEQAFHLWSLEEIIHLCGLRGEDPEPYIRKKEHILKTLTERHWDEVTGFYYDFDIRGGKLFMSKNLDPFYLMFFERDKRRVERLVAHLRSTGEFNLGLLPSLALDELDFDPQSYWAGAAWPREQCFPAVSLARQGYTTEAFEVITRAVCCEEGPLFAENVNPLTSPLLPNGHVFSMVMSSANQVALLDVLGKTAWSPRL